ncbi:unnamed protein product [Bursaphelenchus xylophilus]|uniref:(pine wood nematode) hypothetical protein n=1 Tax=Bursaphelenchus xylophilus TaxID=6326 RepID=A0A7I8WIC2_BURXY|nr:unnamed protein product [Bursaphelenchus xylophilus]CAG9108945.1 unnamed protein product [Bursaphelenchus xylophilus]
MRWTLSAETADTAQNHRKEKSTSSRGQEQFKLCPGGTPLFSYLNNLKEDQEEEKKEAIHLRTQHSRRRQRVLFTPEQIQTLENRFENAKYLTPSERDRLAAKLGLTSTQIKIWFQNRRYKRRRIDQDLALQSVGLGLGVPLMDPMMNDIGTPNLHDLIFSGRK